MPRSERWILAGTLAALLAASPAAAHHSGAMFDRSKQVVLKGTIIELSIVAPHSWISIMVKDSAGAQARWDVEGPTAGRMLAQGVTPKRLKVGDTLTVRCHPLRDGRRGCGLIDFTLADGGVFTNNTTKLQVGQ